MYHLILHRCYLSPLDLGASGFGRCRQLLHRLTDHFKFPDDGILPNPLESKCFISRLGIALDVFYCFDNMAKVNSLVLHKGLASARIMPRK